MTSPGEEPGGHGRALGALDREPPRHVEVDAEVPNVGRAEHLAPLVEGPLPLPRGSPVVRDHVAFDAAPPLQLLFAQALQIAGEERRRPRTRR